MEEKLSKEKIGLFDSVIKSLRLTLTNSSLYPPDHPAFISSIESFKYILEKWLTSEERLELGISSNNILLNGAFVKESGNFYSDIADNLHQKGLIAISFMKGIDAAELLRFFSFLKNDAKAISEKGGIAKNVGIMAHLIIKEADYSSLLTSAKTTGTMDEKEIWRSLSGIGKDLRKGRLPGSKAEFMTGFLKDPKKAAAVLNKIYKEALAKIDRQSTAEEIRDIFSEMSKYFEKYSDGDTGNQKKVLANIMSNLDPELVVSLFKDQSVDGSAPDLADELFKGFSDDMLANFMASLMQNENNVNEKMIKLFSRLVSGQGRAGSVLPMMTDKLFAGKLLNKDTLSTLQNSIKGLFESHPDDDFITQVYNLTVESFLDKGKGPGSGSGRYSALIDEYNESIKESGLKRAGIRLLLNILWLENDAAKFKKSTDTLVSSFKDIMAAEYISSIKEVFELLTEKLHPEQMKDNAIAEAVKDTLDKLTGDEILGKIISFIPVSEGETLNDIGYIIKNSKERSYNKLLDLFMKEPESANRGKFGHIISKTGDKITKEAVAGIDAAIDGPSFPVAIELYEVLKTVNPQEARAVAGRLIKNKNARVRSRMLDEFSPDSIGEKNTILEIFERETNPDIRKKLLEALIKTKDAETVKKLFERANKGIFKKKLLLELVTLCGTFKAETSLLHLKKILEHRPIINTGSARALRVQSVLSLARIGTPEAMELIRKAANDSDKSVGAMCKLVLESDKRTDEKVI